MMRGFLWPAVVAMVVVSVCDGRQIALAPTRSLAEGSHHLTPQEQFSPMVEADIRSNLQVVDRLKRKMRDMSAGRKGVRDISELEIEELIEKISELNEHLKELQETLETITEQLSDGEDAELPVIRVPCDPETHFMCDKSNCLRLERRCDGVRDCKDGLDEDHGCALTAAMTCRAQEFHCKSVDRCISLKQRCDGTDDCGDSSDELSCAMVNCTESQFRCSTGRRCINISWRCDGDDDCEDSSDEANCHQALCQENQFQCVNGEQCMSNNWRCDGEKDCHDGSDEFNCTRVVCKDDEFLCLSKPQCVSQSRLCDGTADCDDESDEEVCVTFPGVFPIVPRIPSIPPIIEELDGCKQDEFLCNSKTMCVSVTLKCDGTVDCIDGSDEFVCDFFPRPDFPTVSTIKEPQDTDSTTLPPKADGIHEVDGSGECEDGEFLCDDRLQCVRDSFRCDHEDDCTDHSDEIGCFDAVCEDAYLPCSSGDECIHLQWLCDGDIDCFDGTDERDCNSTVNICDPQDHRCELSEMCLSSSSICNGIPDCPDASDEAECSTSVPGTSPIIDTRTICSSHEFRCSSETCIPASFRCDGDSDCPDGGDEKDCPPITCSERDFTCSSDNSCLPLVLKCDGNSDCKDGSDELNCAKSMFLCEAGKFPCANGRSCIYPGWRCDGENDCDDGSDEHDCLKIECPLGRFQCSDDGRCISLSYVCDGVTDCLDASDERYCAKTPCTNSQFKCNHTKICLPKNVVCDGRKDCGDGSDEAMCPNIKPELPPTVPPSVVNPARRTSAVVTRSSCGGNDYTCGDTGRCIPLGWVCDGHLDCLNGQDELQCNKLLRCEGSRGLYLCGDGSTCLQTQQVCDGQEDCPDASDEGYGCRKDCSGHGCSHGCFNTPTGVQCTCPPDLSLDHLGTTCAGGPNSSYVLVGLKNSLEAYSTTGGASFTVFPGKSPKSGVIGVSFDPMENVVYWTMIRKGGVYRMDLHNSGPALLFLETGGVVVESMAVDWLGRNLYLVDAGAQRARVCSLSTTRYCADLFPLTNTHPRALRLDLYNRRMFWSDWRSGVINASDLDGGRVNTVTSQTRWPNGLALDQRTRTIYWVDAFLDRVEKSTYVGDNRVVVNHIEQQHPFSMDIYNNDIYFGDWTTSQIYRCDKNHCTKTFNVTDHLGSPPFGIRIIHPGLRDELPNPCETTVCSHICALSAMSPKGYSCLCPADMMLKDDQHTCQPSSTPDTPATNTPTGKRGEVQERERERKMCKV